MYVTVLLNGRSRLLAVGTEPWRLYIFTPCGDTLQPTEFVYPGVLRMMVYSDVPVDTVWVDTLAEVRAIAESHGISARVPDNILDLIDPGPVPEYPPPWT